MVNLNKYKITKKRYFNQVLISFLAIFLTFLTACTSTNVDLVKQKNEVLEKKSSNLEVSESRTNKTSKEKVLEIKAEAKIITTNNKKDVAIDSSKEKIFKKKTDSNIKLKSKRNISSKKQKVAIKIDPNKLIGMTTDKISYLMGHPNLRRVETPAEVWQYSSKDCVFDVVFYEKEDNKNILLTEYFEARDRSANYFNASKCLEDIIKKFNENSG